jgi:hypothetical protein
MNSENLILVATYKRTIQASLERIWENVLDWEHLPWLHRRSFLSIRLLGQSSTGWRACVKLPPVDAPREVVIGIETDQSNLCYWSRTLEGRGAGTEILTCLQPRRERETDIEVEFRVPGVNTTPLNVVGAAFLRLYARLWDEDEAMMVRRQALLDAQLIRTTPLVLKKRKEQAVMSGE